MHISHFWLGGGGGSRDRFRIGVRELQGYATS